MSRMPIGTTVTLVDARSSTRQLFAGIINGHDENPEKYLVTKFSRTRVGALAVPSEIVEHAVRVGDGTDIRPGERYFIVAFTGSVDAAAMVTSLTSRVDELVTKTAADREMLVAAIRTLSQVAFVGQQISDAVVSALTTGKFIPAAVPAPAAPAQPAAAVDLGEDPIDLGAAASREPAGDVGEPPAPAEGGSAATAVREKNRRGK